MNNLTTSPSFRRILFLFVILVATLSVFLFGVAVGRFHSGPRGMIEMHRGPMARFGMMPMPRTHAAFGDVMYIAPPFFTIHGKDARDQRIETNTSTIFRKGPRQVFFNEMVTGTPVGVFGEPADDGAIRARLIRILDSR